MPRSSSTTSPDPGAQRCFVLETKKSNHGRIMFVQSRLTQFEQHSFYKSLLVPSLVLNDCTMSQADEEFLAGLGPPPYHLSTETLEKLFKQYKPRDISVLQLINAPAWIEQAGRHSELYRLFWQNVPLLIPAEAFISIINEDTNEDLAKLSFRNVWRFIERYFFGSNYSWLAEKQKVVFEISLTWCFEESLQAEGSFPTVSVNNLAALFEVYNKLQCDIYPDRLVRTFVWKDARGNRRTSKQPNTKRNMTFELDFSLAIHPILDDALDIWSKYIACGQKTLPTKDELKWHLAKMTQQHILDLWTPPIKRGYMKLWMIDAFEAMSRPGMRMDQDMQACLACYNKPLAEISPIEDMFDTVDDPPLDWYLDELPCPE